MAQGRVSKWKSHVYMGPETKNSPNSINTSSFGDTSGVKIMTLAPHTSRWGRLCWDKNGNATETGLNVCPWNSKGRWKYFLLIWSVFEERKVHLPNWPIKSEMRIFLRSAAELSKIWAIYLLRLSLNLWKNF